jgi:uncharacterized protein DUF3761
VRACRRRSPAGATDLTEKDTSDYNERVRTFTVWVLAAVVLAVCAAAGRAAPPPSATAQCRDGTYSFSQHRSGTCSHHGGVARWLDGSTASGTQSPPRTLAVGATVLLAPRTRTAGCRLGAEPDRRCSPGAYYAGLGRSVICGGGFRTSTIRNVPQSEKFAVEREYGLARLYGRTLEIDHIVPLELGGSTDIANLFPERGYSAKDRLENALHDRVCSGQMALRAAQRRIAAGWQALFRGIFGGARSSRGPARASGPSPPGSRSGTQRARRPARARGWR